jgi:hypothetical protein
MTTKMTFKRVYNTPNIDRVQLDNEISLTLESDPPGGPFEITLGPDSFNNDPFKSNLA